MSVFTDAVVALNTTIQSLVSASKLKVDGSGVTQPVSGVVSNAPAPTWFVPIKAQAITAGTPFDYRTPTSGKKNVVLGYELATTNAGAILLLDGIADDTGEYARILCQANVSKTSPNLGTGKVATAANTHAGIDVTVSGTVSGFIFGAEV